MVKSTIFIIFCSKYPMCAWLLSYMMGLSCDPKLLIHLVNQHHRCFFLPTFLNIKTTGQSQLKSLGYLHNQSRKQLCELYTGFILQDEWNLIGNPLEWK